MESKFREVKDLSKEQKITFKEILKDNLKWGVLEGIVVGGVGTFFLKSPMIGLLGFGYMMGISLRESRDIVKEKLGL